MQTAKEVLGNQIDEEIFKTVDTDGSHKNPLNLFNVMESLLGAGNVVLDVKELQSLMRQMSAVLEAAFASIDSNQDGKISFEEMKQVRFIRKQCNDGSDIY